MDRLLGFFSGVPNRRFPRDIAERLRGELMERSSLVFVCTDPAGHAKTDWYAAGMHGMFEEIGMPFAGYYAIDDRMEPSRAAGLIQAASCVWLMGGQTPLQMQFLRETGLARAIQDTQAAILGLSAGAINMGKRSLDVEESLEPYEGLGLADITVTPHFQERRDRLPGLLRLSEELPICAMEDDSAIFVKGDRISSMGKIHWIHRGKICPLCEGGLLCQAE